MAGLTSQLKIVQRWTAPKEVAASELSTGTGHSTTSSSRPRQPLVIATFVALIVACALILVLAARMRTLAAQNGQLRRQALVPFPGFVVPTFTGITTIGDSVVVGEMREGSGAQVLFVFNTQCPICKATVPHWNAIGDSVLRIGGRVSALGMSLDSLTETVAYMRSESLRYPVVRFPDAKHAVLYRAAAVPQTLVVNSRGIVEFARIGRLDSIAIDSLFIAVKRYGR